MMEEEILTPKTLKMKSLKKGEFYVVPRWTAENLRLESGAMRDIYSIIYGHSQDGDSVCACTLKYFMEWTGASERCVRDIIGRLVEADYISRKEVGSGRGSHVEYRVNLEIVDSCRKGAIFAPIEKGAKISEKGAKISEKPAKSAPFIPILLLRDNNNIIIYNNIFLSRMGAKEQKEEENISEFFFWKNAAEPRLEARGFIRGAELSEWKDARGRSLDTQRKVLTWADGWELRHGSQRTDPRFLKLWNMLYCFLLIEGNPVAPHLLSKRVSYECTDADCTLYASSVVVNFLVDNIEPLPDTDPKKCILKAIRNNRQLFYQAYTL